MRIVWTGVTTLLIVSAVVAAQAPPPAKRPAVASTAAKPVGTLAQVMRGIYFPNSNVIFDVQQHDPAVPKTAEAGRGSSAATVYGSTYSGWEASRTPRSRSRTAWI